MSRKKKTKPPECRWPWCEVCQEHVREIDGAKHTCQPRQLTLPIERAA